jgi:5-methylthioadenosine/S-adenosylhomocysteine deaminase
VSPAIAADAMPASCDLVITNAYLITIDPRRSVYRHGAVAIDGRDIVMVGPAAEVLARCRGRRSIDARGAPVHPGFVDAHYHVPNQLTRGVFPDTAAMSDYYLCYARWYERMDAEDEHASALSAGLEMLQSGVTCFMEAGTVFETDAVAQAAEAVGLRASLSEPFLWDTGEHDVMSHMTRARPDPERCFALLGRELRRNRDPHALVRGHVRETAVMVIRSWPRTSWRWRRLARREPCAWPIGSARWRPGSGRTS